VAPRALFPVRRGDQRIRVSVDELDAVELADFAERGTAEQRAEIEEWTDGPVARDAAA